jgi:tRNA splicing ligase
MKIGNPKVKAPVEVDTSDVLQSVFYWANKNKANGKELSKMIMDYLQEKKNMKVFGVQRNEDLSKITAEIETDLSNLIEGVGNVSLLGTPRKPPTKEKASNEGFNRVNRGFNSYVRTIVDEKKAKGLSYLSFNDLHKILLQERDAKGYYVFIKDKNGNSVQNPNDGTPMDRWRMKQYLTPSQIAKHAVLKGIKRSKDNEGITF